MSKNWWEETPEEFVAGFTEESQVHHSNPLLSESEQQIYTLVPSMNSGRYSLDDAETGRDISSGDSIAILLNGQWIEGHVEHSGKLYAIESIRKAERGYYFIARNGGICGLCSGMKVKLL